MGREDSAENGTFIQSFTHSQNICGRPSTGEALLPLGYVSEQDGQNPCPLGTELRVRETNII